MPRTAYAWHFFISYNKADVAWAEWLAWTLEEAGFKAVLQKWDFPAGSNFVIEMQRATSKAERTIAVFSPDYLSSGFTAAEWAAAFACDPTGTSRKLVPVLVHSCNPEGLLGSIVHIDLTNKDETAARTTLLNGLELGRLKPVDKPTFPAAGKLSKIFPGALPIEPRTSRPAIAITLRSGSDLTELRRAIERRNPDEVTSILSNKGRSIIETGEAPEFLRLTDQVVQTWDKRSLPYAWAKYLELISKLFRDRDIRASIITDELIESSENAGLPALLLAERMEFARKRGDAASSIQFANQLIERLRHATLPQGDAGSAYAVATAYFLLSNLFRAGGRYADARVAIEQARSIYRPSIVAHQIELAHCEYALAVCRSIEGDGRTGAPTSLLLSPELRQFAEGLLTLAKSHSAWASGLLVVAIEEASLACKTFRQIEYEVYAQRAERLRLLLQTWRCLELGAKPDQINDLEKDDLALLRGWLGDPGERARVVDWIAKSKPANVLGMLQFSSGFGNNWAVEAETFPLCPVLIVNGERLSWQYCAAQSFRDADRQLRKMMAIDHTFRLPLLPH